MNSITTTPVYPLPQSNDHDRCQHRTPAGRRCRLACKDSRSRYCHPHDLAEQHRHDGDRCDAILGEPDPRNFNTAAGINRSLTGLYVLLAEDKISPRRAAVLAYISSLQLRSLPAIALEAPPPRVVFDWPNSQAPAAPDPDRQLEMPAHNAGVLDPKSGSDPNAPHDPWDGWRPPKD